VSKTENNINRLVLLPLNLTLSSLFATVFFRTSFHLYFHCLLIPAENVPLRSSERKRTTNTDVKSKNVYAKHHFLADLLQRNLSPSPIKCGAKPRASRLKPSRFPSTNSTSPTRHGPVKYSSQKQVNISQFSKLCFFT